MTKESVMEPMSISEFARRSRLSPKALRLYDEMRLLPPARVDTVTGYRFYGTDQVESARLIAALRQLGIPLAEIRVILHLDPEAAAERVAHYWSGVEAEHEARQDLAAFVVARLHGKRSVMYEVETREIPRRSVLCLKRTIDTEAAVWAFGKEVVGLLKERPLPRMEGRAGALYCIWWAEVNDDSNGPLEWCRPVPDDEAEALAQQFPEFTLRTEPGHREAFVNLGPGGQRSAVHGQLLTESLRSWVDEQGVEPLDLGVRMTLLVPEPRTEDSVPNCDFAVPFTDRTV